MPLNHVRLQYGVIVSGQIVLKRKGRSKDIQLSVTLREVFVGILSVLVLQLNVKLTSFSSVPQRRHEKGKKDTQPPKTETSIQVKSG